MFYIHPGFPQARVYCSICEAIHGNDNCLQTWWYHTIHCWQNHGEKVEIWKGAIPSNCKWFLGKGVVVSFPFQTKHVEEEATMYFQHVYIKSSVVTRCTNIVFPLPVGNLFQSSHSPLVICLDPCLAGHHLRMPKVRGNAWRVRGKFIKKKGGAAGIVSHI